MPAPLIQATGRRKRSVARVRFREGTGKVLINDKPAEEYFPTERHRFVALEPLRTANIGDGYDVDATVTGGGNTGQAGAIRLGVARAIVALDPELRVTLKQEGMLTRDARKKESKKYGLKKARKAPQYSKR